MGSPISGITAEIFLQHLEQAHIKFLLEAKHIAFYARYMDDILIVYNTTHTNPDTITQYANSMHRYLQLKPTLESNGQISFLDLTIIRNDIQLEIDIFRKPTTTDTTINYKSNHPGEHKLAAYRYYIERMFNLPLNTFIVIVDHSRFNNSCLKSPASTLVDLIFKSRVLCSFSLNQLCDLSI
jgi:hypothetical protein